MPRKDTIKIRNASFYAYHGVATDEQTLGGKFEVDVELQGDLSASFDSDDLTRTVNYETVYAYIQDAVMKKRHYLLESLAAEIARGLMEAFGNINAVKATVRKPHPPVKGVVDYVEVEIKESR